MLFRSYSRFIEEVDTPLWLRAPFPLPKSALTAAAVGDEVVRVWREAKTGVVDLA